MGDAVAVGVEVEALLPDADGRVAVAVGVGVEAPIAEVPGRVAVAVGVGVEGWLSRPRDSASATGGVERTGSGPGPRRCGPRYSGALPGSEAGPVAGAPIGSWPDQPEGAGSSQAARLPMLSPAITGSTRRVRANRPGDAFTTIMPSLPQPIAPAANRHGRAPNISGPSRAGTMPKPARQSRASARGTATRWFGQGWRSQTISEAIRTKARSAPSQQPTTRPGGTPAS